MSSINKTPRIFLSPPHMSGAEKRFVEEAFASNYIAPVGPMVDAFEREFAAKVGLPHAVALSSGTAALHLMMRHLGVGPGDCVLCSTLTFVASITPAVQMGATPVFIDSDEATWNMDPALLAEALADLKRKGKRAKAVVAVDLYGQCCDHDRIREACRAHDVPVIEDAAEALGATYKNQPAGHGGVAAIYSFNGNKILTTSGGGMLASADEKVISQARFLATQARDPAAHYEHSQLGYNYRLSNVLAAIGRGQLTQLDSYVSKRRKIFEWYAARIGALPGVAFMPEAPYGRANRWLTVMTLDPAQTAATPEKIRLALEAENIEARPVWKPMHEQPVFRGGAIYGGPVAAKLFRNGICLPSGSALTENDVDRISGIVRKALARG